VVNTAMAGKARFDEMRAFFEGVGTGHAAGVWEGLPKDRPEFRAQHLAKLGKKPKSEEAIGC
jgi:chlorophyllide a reductase subunit Y